MSPQAFWYDTVLVTWPHLQSKRNKSLKLATHKKNHVFKFIQVFQKLWKLHYFYTERSQEYICRLLLFLTAKPTNRMRGLGKESQMRNFLDPKWAGRKSLSALFSTKVWGSSSEFWTVSHGLFWVFLIPSNQFGMRFWSNFQNNVGLERLWRAQKLSDGLVLVWSCLCWSWCLFSFSAICLFFLFKKQWCKKKKAFE